MPFSPEEIEHKTFVTVLRGYDKVEVAAFLRAVSADYRRLSEAGAEIGQPAPAEDAPSAPANLPAVSQVSEPQSSDQLIDALEVMRTQLRAGLAGAGLPRTPRGDGARG